MTGLMVVIVLLLIVMVVWMVVITSLYYSIYRGFLALRDATETAIPAQNETIRAIVDEMDAFMDILKTVEEQSFDCYEVAKGFVRDAEENKKIAMTTIKAVRQIKASMQTTSFLEQATAEISEETRFDAEEVNDEGTEGNQG